MQIKKKRHPIRNFILVILLLTAIYWIGINLLVSAVLVPSFMERLHAFDRIVEQSYAEQVQETGLQNNAVSMYVIGSAWARQNNPEQVSILSEDGYRLRGVLFERGSALGEESAESEEAPASGEEAFASGEEAPASGEEAFASGEEAPASGEEAFASGEEAPASGEGKITTDASLSATETTGSQDSHNWVILLHGYTGSKEMMYGYAYWYWNHGYSVLAPDFRCQGESDGDYIGLGATDSGDLLGWIDLILQRDPSARIVLHGLSMGASTALICSGKEEIPANVVAVISDCAYTDAYAMFQEKIGSWFHLPAFPIVDSAELMIRLRAGYDLKETSPLVAVARSRIPTLFIHGKEDRMIPVKMCLLLYNAAACDKEIMIIDHAGHAQAAEKDPLRYFETVEEFLKK